MGKSKKNKQDSEASTASAAVDDSDSGEDDDRITIQKKSVFQMFALDDDEEDGKREEDDDDDDDEDKEVMISSIKSKKKKNKKAKKETTEDIDDEFDFIEKEKEKPKGKKEKKGKNRKKINEDEEEIERMLAELELEYSGTSTTTKKPTPTVATTENKAETTKEEDTKKKKRKKKQKEKEDDGEEQDEEREVEEDLQEEKKKKKTKKKKGKEEQVEDETKTTAPEDDQVKEEDDKEQIDETVKTSEAKSNVEEVEKDEQKEKKDEEDAVETDDKMKPDKKEKEDKKRPGKKQLLVMQEALKKLKDEEERIAREEEAKIKAAEDAQRLIDDQVRLEKEKKELRKQKEREKKERLKAEGKYMTKAQLAQRARAIATIEAFRAQGIDIPNIGEKRGRPARPPLKSKVSKGKTNKDPEVSYHTKNGEQSVTPSLDRVPSVDKSKLKDEISSETQLPITEAKPLEDEVKVEEKIEGPKDTWDLSSDSEKEEEPKDKKTETAAPKTVAVATKTVAVATKTVAVATKTVAVAAKTVAVATKTVQISIKKEPSNDKKQLPNTKGKSSGESESSDEEEESESEDEDESDDDDESESDDNHKSVAERLRERASTRIQKRREENEKKRTQDELRSPIVCVLGHVDTGKTKILDKIRHTHVQDSEAGGITQQIGATMVPVYAIKEQAKMVKNFSSIELRYPGLLIIDTPGHESFSNLRSRGSSLCDIAILVVDIMHGLEPQTIESINLLKKKKTPFVVALNKLDRIFDWKVTRNKDIRDSVKSQSRNTVMEFEDRTNHVIVQFAEQGLNAALFYENKDVRTYVSLIPTSATTGEGMGNLLALVVELTQNMLAKRLAFSEELQATILELKAIPGLGTTVDVILVNGRLKEGDTIVLAGMDGPVVTQIRSLLMPQPLKELRVKNPYQEYKEVKAAQGVKLTAKDLEKVIAGLNLTVAHHPDEIEILKEDVSREFHTAMNSIKLAERGVYVQASTLGSLEALLEFLRTSKVPYSGIRIGPVVKRDVMKASIMLEHDSQFAVILAFDVKIERDAHELADSLGVKIFSADIIYHLFDRFTEYREQLKAKKREEFKHIAVFPCKLRILPNCIFNSRDPIVVGVSVEAGVIKEGTTLCVPSQEFLDVGIVTTIEINHKQIDTARKGQEVCIKIEPIPGDSPKLYGRHFDHTDMLVSKVTRQSIDACKEYFRDDLQKSDWQLMVELKKLFEIL